MSTRSKAGSRKAAASSSSPAGSKRDMKA
jgi:hypothetical protein